MASAILTSRNGPCSSDLMSKFTSNGDLNFTRLQNIPNPNPNSSHFFVGNTSRDVLWKSHQQLPYSALPHAAFIRTSINSVPGHSYGYRYVTFRLGSYSRRELRELKKRLISDLERVRVLRQRVCSTSTPKTNYHPPQLELPLAPEALLKGKDRHQRALGQKRTNPLPPVRDTKKQSGRMTNAQKRKTMMRECGQILGKLMKHKHGWVFNTPVDAAALKLYDYHNIISNPMDLGTIKSKLTRNEYESPLAFASDVRLTFQNAMVYNGKGSHVFIMAESLLSLFEDVFDSTHRKFVVNQVKKQNRSANVPISIEKPVSNTTIVVETPVVPSANAANSGTPMARFSNKPEMTPEEKSELAASLLNLPLGREGMNQIMTIVKKGVLGLEHQGDEIELDLAVLDNDTLWGLHSFISRTRKELITNLISSAQTDHYPGNEEDVDIGEEMQSAVFPSIEIEKEGVDISVSKSTSDCGSSSSDSGSGTCSGNSYNEQEGNSTQKAAVR